MEILNYADSLRLQPANEQFAFVDHLRRQVIVQIDEQLFMADDLSAPGLAIDFLQLFEFLARIIKALPVMSS